MLGKGILPEVREGVAKILVREGNPLRLGEVSYFVKSLIVLQIWPYQKPPIRSSRFGARPPTQFYGCYWSKLIKQVNLKCSVPHLKMLFDFRIFSAKICPVTIFIVGSFTKSI